jgi:hypothetical protein
MNYPPKKFEIKLFFPKGHRKPNYLPNNRKQTSTREEAVLRSLSDEVDRWLTESLVARGISRHHFLKKALRIALETGTRLIPSSHKTSRRLCENTSPTFDPMPFKMLI